MRAHAHTPDSLCYTAETQHWNAATLQWEKKMFFKCKKKKKIAELGRKGFYVSFLMW